MQRLWGWAQQGGKTVTTGGVVSANNTLVQRTYPGATVTVYQAGSNNLATLYADNNSTPLANPFTANNVTGYWDFYAASGSFDIQFSGNNAGIPTPFTLPDVSLGGLQSINGQTGAVTLQVGTAGNNFNISANNNNITFNLPQANNNNNGYLSAADWATFNSKGGSLNFAAPLSSTNNNVSLTTPLAITYGGTNSNTQTEAFDNLAPLTTKGDLVAFDGNNGVRLAVGANNNYVLAVDSSAATGMRWVPVPVGNANGILPIANGGTGGNNNTQAFTNLSPITTKGDIIAGNNNAVPVRLGIGATGTLLQANSSNTSGMSWGPADLSNANSFTGTLPIANGGTGANSAANAFTALSPMTAKGDLITANNNNMAVRLPAGTDGYLLSANSANANGLAWIPPVYAISKYTIASNNNNFAANSNTVSITLFTLGQYQKIAGVTIKPSALFLNANNTITDVQITLGIGGNANLYTSAYSVGNNGAIGNSNFQDTALFKSGNMGGNTAVVAQFVAANNNFGNGANTVLTGGSVDIWITVLTLQ